MASKDTRQKILEAALELFRERGFAEATMREIASRAGVATGLAYYYFESKDAIVLAFYQRAKEDLAVELEAAQKDKRLAPRLQALIEAKFNYFRPNRAFLGALMAHAADAASPLSPFGEPSREVREFDLAHFERALAETKTSVPGRPRAAHRQDPLVLPDGADPVLDLRPLGGPAPLARAAREEPRHGRDADQAVQPSAPPAGTEEGPEHHYHSGRRASRRRPRQLGSRATSGCASARAP